MSEYSGTPLAPNLGIRPGSRAHVHALPPRYPQLVAPLPKQALMLARPGAAAYLCRIFALRAWVAASRVATGRASRRARGV